MAHSLQHHSAPQFTGLQTADARNRIAKRKNREQTNFVSGLRPGAGHSRHQLEALCTFAQLVSERSSGAEREILALAVGRVANAWTSLCRWHQSGEKIEGAFNG